MFQLTSIALTESALQGGANRRHLTLGCQDLSDLLLYPSLAKSLLPAMAHCPGFSKPRDHFLDSRAWLFHAPLPPTFWNFKPQNAKEGGGKRCQPPAPIAQLPPKHSLRPGKCCVERTTVASQKKQMTWGQSWVKYRLQHPQLVTHPL